MGYEPATFARNCQVSKVIYIDQPESIVQFSNEKQSSHCFIPDEENEKFVGLEYDPHSRGVENLIDMKNG